MSWIALCWSACFFTIYLVSHFMGFVLLIVASPFIHPKEGMDLGPIAAVGLWISLGIGALSGAGTYLWLRSIAIKRQAIKKP